MTPNHDTIPCMHELIQLFNHEKQQSVQERMQRTCDTCPCSISTSHKHTDTCLLQEYVVAYLAILKAGAAYCPLELAYPKRQIARVCEDVAMIMILTKSAYESALPQGHNIFCLDINWSIAATNHIHRHKHLHPQVGTRKAGSRPNCDMLGSSTIVQLPLNGFAWLTALRDRFPTTHKTCSNQQGQTHNLLNNSFSVSSAKPYETRTTTVLHTASSPSSSILVRMMDLAFRFVFSRACRVMITSWSFQSTGCARPLQAQIWANQHEPTLDSLCYLVYSSGTTGQPKGIAASHRSPVNSYLWR